MGALVQLIAYAIGIGIISVIAYYVIKKAVKDGIREAQEEIRRQN